MSKKQILYNNFGAGVKDIFYDFLCEQILRLMV